MPCQSGRSAGTLGGLVLIAATAPAGAAPTGWAHQATGFQNNGAVTVKSLAGGSYAGTQNPTGAVAKTNQSAATQAPTVIIQATSAGYAEIIPLFVSGSVPQVAPTCPAGYTTLWSITTPANYKQIVFNIAGTRFSYGYYYIGSYNIGFFVDGSFAGSTTGANPIAFTNDTIATGWSGTTYTAARLCSR